jgi:formamidopyrimidine-DNA glycosylase
MPELPDLEVHTKNLTKLCKGCKVAKVIVQRPKRVHPSEEALNKALDGATLTRFERSGKQMRVLFSNGKVLGVHMMLNGEIHVCSKDEEAKFVSCLISFTDGKSVAFTDRQTWITVNLDPGESSVPDALGSDFDLDYFIGKLKAKAKTPIKILLIDQDVVQGIGNAYADEILWQARVDPASLCKDLPPPVVKTVYGEIGKTLKRAINDIEKNHPDLSFGEPREHLAVHNNGKDRSPTGRPILTKEVKGKKTYYTEEQVKY